MTPDERDWYAHGVWVCADDESLYMARSVESAEEIVRDHNDLAAQLRDTRAEVERQQKLVLRQTQLNTEVTLRAMEAESQRSALAASLTEVEKERDEANAAHELMSKQFRTMQVEKEHGWGEADRQETRADAAEARLAVVRKALDGMNPNREELRTIRQLLDAEAVTEHE